MASSCLQRCCVQEAERQAADLEHNRGIYLRLSLAAAPAHAASAIARGIRRAADKLTLPATVGASLMSQGAPKNGAMFFEVSAPNGAKTHAGVLEFTAPEGVVLLPEKVVNCLWGMSGASAPSTPPRSSSGAPSPSSGPAALATSLPSPWSDGSGGGPSPVASSSRSSSHASTSGRCCGQVTVSYMRLEKGTYVRFQPELKAFHDEVGADPEVLREVLEECLMTNCTLTEGDWIQVRVGRVRKQGNGWLAKRT